MALRGQTSEYDERTLLCTLLGPLLRHGRHEGGLWCLEIYEGFHGQGRGSHALLFQMVFPSLC